MESRDVTLRYSMIFHNGLSQTAVSPHMSVSQRNASGVHSMIFHNGLSQTAVSPHMSVSQRNASGVLQKDPHDPCAQVKALKKGTKPEKKI